MGADSKIQWTTHTFNPWRGCSKVHAGCTNCYAETLSGRNPGTLGVWGRDGTRVVASESMWKEPLKWNRDAEKAGERRRVFCASLADVFEDWRLPVVNSRGNQLFIHSDGTIDSEPHGRQASLSDVRRRLFALRRATPWLDWLFLTKRPENVEAMTLEAGDDYYAENRWIGTSVSDQATADKANKVLVKLSDMTPVLFVSAEPLVGPVDLDLPWIHHPDGTVEKTSAISWVIVGGESGHGARSYCTEWAASIIDQCKNAGVPVFHKQLGAMPFTLHKPHGWPDGTSFSKEYHNVFGDCWLATLKDPKGGDMSEWPESLRVREFPAVVPV